MQRKEKTINGRTFFIGKINPVEMMTISRAGIALYKKTKDEDGNESFEIDLSTQRNIDALGTFYTLAFEHVYVQITDTIVKPVKEKGAEVWWPENIADDYETLFALSNWFFEEVVFPVFLRSSGSTQNSDSLEESKETSKNANDKA